MYKKEELEKIVNESFSKTEVLKKLGKKSNGGNFNGLTFYLNLYEIDISHFNERGFLRKNKNGVIVKKKTEDILVKDSNYMSSNHLKKRLYREGLKKKRCEICGQDENWNGKKMSLILDHINGSKFDNRLENLRIVCPNCNATLDTHCRGDRYKKNEKIKKNKKIKTCECGTKIKNTSKKCVKCNNLSQRRVKRPEYEVLLKEIKDNGYTATGKKYGVSDNAIRKWLKKWES